MRILYLNPIGALGGAERSLLDVIAVVREEPGLTLKLIAFAPGPFLTEVERLGVQAESVEMPQALTQTGDSGLRGLSRARIGSELLWKTARLAPSLAFYAGKLRRAVHEFKPDVIHSNGIKAHLLGAVLRPRRTKLLWHIRDFLGERPLIGSALRLVSARAHLAIAISDAVALQTSRILPGLKVHRMYDGIDTDAFSPRDVRVNPLDAFDGRNVCEPGTLRVGLLGTYARWKGHDVFLRAAAKVLAAPQSPPIRFYVVGGPLYATAGSQYSLEELEAMARELGLVGHVTFVPFQQRPEDVYRALDVVVHASSRPEPFGRTIVEPMATGKAVIAAKAGGAAELFTDGVDALGFEPGNAPALAEVILKLTDRGLRERLGSEARKSAVHRFSRERLRPEVVQLYRDLVSG